MRRSDQALLVVLAFGGLLSVVSAEPRPFDRQHGNGHFVQDWRRDHNFVFGQIDGAIPAYVQVRHLKTWKGHHSYSVQGATLCYSKGSRRYYGAQLPLHGSHLIQVTEYLLPKKKPGEEKMNIKRRWPSITVGDPEPLYINRAGNHLAPSQKVNPGLFMGVNNNDDDQDGILDLGDDDVPGESSMIAVNLVRPKGMPVQLSWDDSIVHLYETPRKIFVSSNEAHSARIGGGGNTHAYKGYDDQVIYIEGVAPGSTEITLTGPGGFSDKMKVNVVAIEIVADWNHDRRITSEDENQATAFNPFRFWINDDNDSGDISYGGSDLPGQDINGELKPDYSNDNVDGRRDLLDFFPIWLDLKKVLDLLPPSATVKYKLRQVDSAVNAAYTDLIKGRAGDFLTTEGDSYGHSLNEVSYDAETFQVLASGVELGNEFLGKIINDENKGVLMVEGNKETSAPLVLEVWINGIIICETELPISIAGVEKMYRWINVRDAAGGSVTRPTDAKSEPENYPDSYCNGKQFIFVHGYNVHEEGARAWNAEIFKRLYQSGSRAMFTGVTWFGNEGQASDWVPFLGGTSPDYYSNVENAFDSASSLVTAIGTLPGSKYVAGHSLGNMLVSSAIVDAGLSVSAYYMFNAAVALEAFDGTIMTNTLRPPDWEDYSMRLWASEWYRLFDGIDGRRALTWRDRFGAISVAHNYYSSTEDVLENADGNVPFPGRVQSWVCQEMRKGTELIWWGPGNNEGGWGFDWRYFELTTAQANSLPNSELQTNSFFLHFDNEQLYGSNGGAVAQQPAMHRQLLADAIPALSNPLGRNPLIGFGRGNTDLKSFVRDTYDNGGWPREQEVWRHSDIKDVAYPFNYRAFDEIVSSGSLK